MILIGSFILLGNLAVAVERNDMLVGYTEYGTACKDLDRADECQALQNKGACVRNPYHAISRCKESCGLCQSLSPWSGFATTEMTRKYSERVIDHKQPSPGHFRQHPPTSGAQPQLIFGSLGIGTYLGSDDVQTDEKMMCAVLQSVNEGMNVIDTAHNYRFGNSENSVGRALQALRSDGEISREMLFISTKAGFLDRPILEQLLSERKIEKSEITADIHCISPACLEKSLQLSLSRLNLQTIDLLYLHNPAELILNDRRSKDKFWQIIKKAFSTLEAFRARGLIRSYGIASWDCFRVPPDSPNYVSLDELVQLALKVQGPNHGFRYIQLPVSAGNLEAYSKPWQYILDKKSQDQKFNTSLRVAADLGLGVFTSQPLGAGELIHNGNVLDTLRKEPKLAYISEPLQLLDFARSLPGVLTTLVGHKTALHTAENLQLVRIRPLFPRTVNALAKLLTR